MSIPKWATNISERALRYTFENLNGEHWIARISSEKVRITGSRIKFNTITISRDKRLLDVIGWLADSGSLYHDHSNGETDRYELNLEECLWVDSILTTAYKITNGF